jgi:hypothetical protein
MEGRVEDLWAVKPDSWFLVFDPHADRKWIRRWVPSHFKHVSAIGYIEGQDVWVWYDVSFNETHVCVRPNADAVTQEWLEKVGRECVVVHVPAQPVRKWWFRWGFWCVPAMKHLTSIRCGALLPDAMLKHCLSQGFDVIGDCDVEGIFGGSSKRATGAGG